MKRSLAILAVPLAVLGFAACGDDDDDPGSTQPDDTEATDDTEASDDTVSDESLPGGTLPGGITVPSLPDISLPDISLPDISIPDISIPDISVPDTESLLRQVFPNLDDDQIDCLGDALGDIGSDFDASQVIDLLGDCNIDMSDIAPGG